MANEDQWCFTWMEELPSSAGRDRAAMIKAAQWTPGDAISISFLDGDQTVRERVKQAALQWVGAEMANLLFVFQKKKDALIRISFKLRGSWSVLGTTCQKIENSRPTMNFGWLNAETPEKELNRVVLHEFGHALGLVHEHQHPKSGIVWNKKNVEKDVLGPKYNWTQAQIKRNLYDAYTKAETNYTKFDKESIMLYPIPMSWTKNGFSSELNTALSPTDIKFIRQRYPAPS